MPRLFGGTRAAAAVAAPTPPLDAHTTNLAGAYSSRKLRTAHAGGAFQMWKTGPTTSDLGFSAGEADASALAAFGTDVFAAKVYDQSGNGRDLLSPNNANQFRLRGSSTNQTRNGHLNAIAPDASRYMITSGFTPYTGETLTMYFVMCFQSGTDYSRALSTFQASGLDADQLGSVGMMQVGSSTTMMAVRNNNLIASAISFVSFGNFIAVVARWDDLNMTMRMSTGTNTTGSSVEPFNVARIGFATSSGTGADCATNQQFCEGAVWFGDIGSTAALAILAEAATYWSVT